MEPFQPARIFRRLEKSSILFDLTYLLFEKY